MAESPLRWTVTVLTVDRLSRLLLRPRMHSPRHSGAGKFNIITHAALDERLDHPRWQAGSDVYERLHNARVDRLVLNASAHAECLRVAAGALPLGGW